jgi:Secretion system C-terminal sorting domain
MNNINTIRTTIQILPSSDQSCGRFIPLRDPQNNDNTGFPQADKTMAEKSDASISDNTEGSNINIVNTRSGTSENSTKAKIYPNPATNEIVIEDLQEAKAIKIFDVTGNFKEQIIVGEESTMLKVNTTKYTNGMYLIQIQNNVGEITTQKVQILK